ncbi:hypothetical protein SKAU_G00238510 [Synaphobranchus kaupii]|uniref:NADH dehydrogenase [ubiquinone] 1 beta subcomplex subunit 3 n=1 Tax=Synaphobranchus kaupii TaxID=118154 RepID=A0A9Q1IT40_SYNKA|nr:hypothetical protein SKAU_G00238510 [Synaphobranchus kaupii]
MERYRSDLGTMNVSAEVQSLSQLQPELPYSRRTGECFQIEVIRNNVRFVKVWVATMGMERLARRGLKDPWARNEAWRYMGGFSKPVTFRDVFLRGFKYGFAAFVVAVGVEYALTSGKKSEH